MDVGLLFVQSDHMLKGPQFADGGSYIKRKSGEAIGGEAEPFRQAGERGT